MELSNQILSDITVHMKYTRFLPDKNRRETWKEIVTRNMEMHLRKYPFLELQIRKAYKMVFDKKVLPSMRSMQFGGKPIEINPARMFNCSFVAVDDYRSFNETMFLLLSGCGVGYSVQKHHVEQLPEIRKPTSKRTYRYLIQDSIEGWADAVKVLVETYFGIRTSHVRFDFGDIRSKGERLITSGGKAPGPQPLKECLLKIKGILDDKVDGEKLDSIECHDIMCYLADAVLSGGIRRAAMISLFSADDNQMLSAKTGTWWENNPQRGRANNSVVLLRHRIEKETFMDLWERIEASGAGEPGFSFTNDKERGFNPCHEISLRSCQMCNLTEINVSDVENQEDFEERARVAAFIGTLQAGYTDFHYLRPSWQSNCERDSLLGVSMTGIASRKVLDLSMISAALVVKEENLRVADLIGINPAARTTAVKPAGTTSLVLGTSSGIHAWHSDYYIRRVRVGKNEPIYGYLLENHPELVEDEYFSPHDTAVISVPQKAPDDAILRTESARQLLKRVKQVSEEWVFAGYRKGPNNHNVSATVSVKDAEWSDVGEWMWENRDSYTGLSVLPYNGGTYKQAPFEDCSKETYEVLFETLKNIDLTKIREEKDNTNLTSEPACAGGSCSLKFL
jgi:ribonucleoside-triphosphate reductase (thioredoxin)